MKAKRTKIVQPLDAALRFTPTAWAKLQFFCHRGDTEIGGFGVCPADDLLLIEEFVTVPQTCSGVSVCFDDAAVADFFEAQVDQGRKPEQFARIWSHTHPGASASPSCTDEETFARVFGGCDWAVMFILSRTGQTYARLRLSRGPASSLLLPVEVDYGAPFEASDHDAWDAEHSAHVHSLDPVRKPTRDDAIWDDEWFDLFACETPLQAHDLLFGDDDEYAIERF